MTSAHFLGILDERFVIEPRALGKCRAGQFNWLVECKLPSAIGRSIWDWRKTSCEQCTCGFNLSWPQYQNSPAVSVVRGGSFTFTDS